MVAVGDHHVALEILQRLAGGEHGVGGAQRRVLHGHAPLAQPLGDPFCEFRRMGPDHHHDRIAAEGLGCVDGAVDQGSPGHRVQHLGQGRFHARALAGSQDDRGALGHGAPSRL